MIQFTTTILKFDSQGEKTGWTYIKVDAKIAEQLSPGNKKSFRVKGKLDDHVINGVSLLPMGGGDFIMAVNAAMRKGIGKRKGDKLKVQLELDKKPYILNPEFMECLSDEPAAQKSFDKLPTSHKNYYSKWIESAKTDLTRTKRIAMAVNALAKKIDFGTMLRTQAQERRDLLG